MRITAKAITATTFSLTIGLNAHHFASVMPADAHCTPAHKLTEPRNWIRKRRTLRLQAEPAASAMRRSPPRLADRLDPRIGRIVLLHRRKLHTGLSWASTAKPLRCNLEGALELLQSKGAWISPTEGTHCNVVVETRRLTRRMM